MPSPRERAQLQAQLRQQQEALVRDLLPVLDALDRAEVHWQQVLAAQRANPPATGDPPGLWARWRRRLTGRSDRTTVPGAGDSAGLARSAGDGIALIRGSLLEALQGHGLEPIRSVGEPFDPERMRALAQRTADPGTAAGSVVEEAVRGYLWRRSLLREAQVVVAGP